MNNEKLYDYIFHYNPYSNVSYAIKRGDGNWENYINGFEFYGFKIKGNDFRSLQSIITKQTFKIKKITR